MPQTPPPAPIQQTRFPCDSCGSDLRFDPAAGLLVCDYCGNTQPLEGIGPQAPPIAEIDYTTALRSPEDLQMEEVRIATCPNCGAEIEFDRAIHAIECPFCATPVVIDTGTRRHIKPQGVVPFALDQRQGKQAMTDWLGSLWFAPSGLTEFARKGRRLQGVYVPYWTYDADTATQYAGQRGTIYYESKTVMRDGRPTSVQVQKIRWRPVSGRVARFFDDVLVLASRSLPKRFTDALAPWDLAALRPYSPEVLAGFRAEGYTITVEDGLTEARAHMDRVIERDIRFDIGGDRQRISDVRTAVSDVTFKHILLPVWMAAYKYRGKTYRFVINGQTGRVQGERPWSAIKIAAAALLGLAVAAVIGYFAAQR